MRLLTGLLITIYCSSTSVQASTWPSFIDGQPTPDRGLQISLSETATTQSNLQTNDFDNAFVERTPVRVCERIPIAAGSCVAIANFAVAVAKSLASTIKEFSDQDSCNTIRGTYESMSWVYHSSGRNCDITTQQVIITGAIKNYLDDPNNSKLCGTECDTNGNELCGTQCLRMDPGGTWDGWLKIGPTANFKSNAYCGPSLTFSSSLSSGNNDI